MLKAENACFLGLVAKVAFLKYHIYMVNINFVKLAWYTPIPLQGMPEMSFCMNIVVNWCSVFIHVPQTVWISNPAHQKCGDFACVQHLYIIHIESVCL